MSRYTGRPDLQIEIPIDPPIRVTGEYNQRSAEFDLDTVRVYADIGSSRDPWVFYEGVWLCKNGTRLRRGFSTDDPAVDDISAVAISAAAVARRAASRHFVATGGEAS